MSDELRSDQIRNLLLESDSDEENQSLFGDDDTDNDPDYVEEESEYSDESSAEEEEESNERRRIAAVLLGRNGYKWSSEEPQRRGRPLSRNLVTHFPCAKGPGKEVRTPLDS